MAVRDSTGLELRLFGRFCARRDGVPLAGLRLRNGEALVAFLVLHHGQAVPDELLARTFWLGATVVDDEMDRALTNLRRSLSSIRDALGQSDVDRIHVADHSVSMDLTGAAVDVLDFDEVMGPRGLQALSADELLERTGGNIAPIRHAAAMYRGPLLEGWSEDWVDREREDRRRQYTVALEVLASEAMAREDWRSAARQLRRYVSQRPSSENGWRDLMEVLLAAGERMEALEVFRMYRDYLYRKDKLAPPVAMEELQKRASARPNGLPVLSPDHMALESSCGAVPLNSLYYVERPADAEFHAAITRRDSTILVNGPRQIGKTSLLARGLEQARAGGARVVLTDLQGQAADDMESLDAFYLAIAQRVATQLDIATPDRTTWSSPLSPNGRFERFILRDVLAQSDAPIVWAIDQVDRLFPFGFGADVFGLLRSWHNRRALEPSGPWERLSLVLAYSTEAHLFIRSLDQSPFNVGSRVGLEDLTAEQVADLNHRHGSPLQTTEAVARFHSLVGGHPYLVRRGLHAIKKDRLDIAAFEAQATREDGIFGDHLDRMVVALLQDPDLTGVVRDLLKGAACPTAESFHRLRAAGVVTGDAPENAEFRCRLYRWHLAGHLL